ncbi:MAG: lysine biosynthesis protein LysX [Candidatus Brockarchaeota archaeon]|nr:lysine biosynthesis protein LysX [Candidatus Brockarchaeota archaeon]
MGGVVRLLGSVAALVSDRVRYEEKSIILASRRLSLPLKHVDAKDMVLELGRKRAEEIGCGTVLMRCVSFYRGLHMTAVLEGSGIRVINSFFTSNTCGNKLLSSVALERHGVKTPRTLVAFTPAAAAKAANALGYPAILKPVVGSWGRLIAPLKDEDTAEAILEDRTYMYPLYQVFYIQEYVNRPPRDIRCVVIGGRPVAAIYRYSPPGEWKTNVAVGGSSEPCKVTGEIEKIAVKASKAVKGEVVGVDMMESEKDGLLVHEVNHTTEFKAAATATGVNIAEEIVKYVFRSMKK